MTLDSRIYVTDEVTPGQAFNFALRAVLTAEDKGRSPHAIRRTDVVDGDARKVETVPGQGLPACVRVYYNPDGPYRANAEPRRGGDPDPACHVEISLETTDAWAGPNGETAEALHIRVVTAVGQALDALGVHWLWLNQATGRVHSGYRHLDKLGLPAAASTREA